MSLTGRDRNMLRKFFEDTLGISHIESESDVLADRVFKHFTQWKDRISSIGNKIASLGLTLPGELNEINQALTECLGNRQVQETLKRLKRNIDIIAAGMSRLLELEESLNEDTERELRVLGNIQKNQVKQLEMVEENAAVQNEINGIEDHFEGTSPWRGWADIKPFGTEILKQYRNVRKALKERQQEALDEQIDVIKLRPDFADIDIEKQQAVLQILRRNFLDLDETAIQPTLLQIKQTPQRIREAASEAHKLIDEMNNEDEAASSPEKERRKVVAVKLNLRNKVIESPEQLDDVLSKVRDKCLRELKSGAKVRLEE